ncbi:hypothetical protein [Microcoleus sp. F10-C6]
MKDSGDFSVCFRIRDLARESVAIAVVINLVVKLASDRAERNRKNSLLV